MNRASKTCRTILNGQTFKLLESQEERKKNKAEEIMAKNFTKLVSDTKHIPEAQAQRIPSKVNIHMYTNTSQSI